MIRGCSYAGGVHLGLAAIVVDDYDSAIKFFTEGLGFELAEGIRDAELAIFEDSSHLAFIEEREAYIRVVEDFLTRIEARASS